mgnify:CR=1 FL=1
MAWRLNSKEIVTVLLLGMTALSGTGWAQQTNGSDQQTKSGPEDEGGADQKGDANEVPNDLSDVFLLDPDERLQIRERQRQDQKANFKPLKDVEPVRDMLRLDFASARIATVFVVPEYPASVVFTDMTGQPWPIRDLAQTESVAQVQKVEGSTNSLVFYGKNYSGEKSVSVYLQGLSMPIVMKVRGTEDRYHAVKNIQIRERGPNSKDLQRTNQAASSSEFDSKKDQKGQKSISQIVDKLAYRVTPEGFKRISVSDGVSDAWLDKSDESKLYLLTPHTISAPGPINGGRSIVPVGDGLRVYVLPRINPVVALNESGQRQYLQFSE